MTPPVPRHTSDPSMTPAALRDQIIETLYLSGLEVIGTREAADRLAEVLMHTLDRIDDLERKQAAFEPVTFGARQKAGVA